MTQAPSSDVLATMLRKKSPRLAAAFVVTVSAGCGSGSSTVRDPNYDPETGAIRPATFIQQPDGKCFLQIPANPPFLEPADCETKKLLKDMPQKATGPENPDSVPNIGAVKGGFVRGGDNKCYIEHPANPPWMEPADCETQQPLKKPDEEKPKSAEPTGGAKPVDPKPQETPTAVVDSNLPEAPKGWRVSRDSLGHCRAFGPPPSCPRGARCNPPPPVTVKCPKDLPKDAETPLSL